MSVGTGMHEGSPAVSNRASSVISICAWKGARRRPCRGVGWGGRAILLGSVSMVALTACDTRPSWERESLGRRYFDSTGTYVHAGISTRADPDIQPLRRSSLGADTASRSYHLYGTRCGSCHEAPDPRMKTGEHWPVLIGRMQAKTRSAGVIPMTDAEADSILRFLRKHTRSPDEP